MVTAAHAVLAAQRDGALHGGQRIQIAGAFVPVPALQRAAPRRGRGLASGIDAAVANGGHKTREAIDAVRIHAVARGFGKEARAGLGAIGGEAELARTAARVCCTSANGMRFMVCQTAELFLQRHRDLARVAAFGGDHDLAGGALANALELLAPLHHHQRIGRKQIVEAERLQLALAFQAIDIEVIELDRLAFARAVVLVNQREGGAGDFVGLGGVEGLRDAFDQRGLSGAQFAARAAATAAA